MVDRKEKFNRQLNVGTGLGAAMIAPLAAEALRVPAASNLFRGTPTKAKIAIGLLQGAGALGMSLLGAAGLSHAIRTGLKSQKKMDDKEKKAVEFATKLIG